MKWLSKGLLTVFSLFILSVSAQNATRVVDGKTYIVHKVVSGETFYKIAKKYGATVAEVQGANPTIKTLHIGDEVLVPEKTATPVEKQIPGQANKTDFVEHTVAKGETLSKIARDYETTVAEIKKLNGLTSEALKIGQVLKIPVVPPVSSKPATPAADKPANPGNTDPAPKADPPAEKKPEEKKPETPAKPAANNGQTAKSDDKTNPGMPASTRTVISETAVEREETGVAVVVGDKMDQTRTFVMHPTLPKGTIIVLINDSTGKMAYCRVVDNIAPSELNGASLAITQSVATKLGVTDTKIPVKIKYAAP